MTFIYKDNSLVEKLLSSAMDFEKKFNKLGQTDPLQQAQTYVRALLTNLKSELDTPKDPNQTEISHQSDGPSVALTSANLESLGSLASFLVSNKITVNGQQVAYDAKEKPDGENYQLFQLEPQGLTEVADNTQVEQGSWINKDLLNKYIVSLQAHNQQNPNPILSVQLNKIVQQANQQLDANVSQKYQAPQKVLPDSTVLDNLPKLLSTSGSYDQGPIPLTYENVKSPEDFNSWLSTNGIELWDDKNRQKLELNQKEFSIPTVANILLERAKFFDSRATPATKSNLDIYVRQMQQLSSKLGSALAGQTNQTGQNNQQSQNAQGTSGDTAIMHAVTALPFSSRDISFDRIKSFFDAVGVALSNDQKVLGLIADATELMNDTNTLMTVEDVFPMGVSPSEFAQGFKDQQNPGRVYRTVISYLKNIIYKTRAVVVYFWTKKAKPEFFPQYQSELEGQVGITPQSSSLYAQNVDALDKLNSAVSQVSK